METLRSKEERAFDHNTLHAVEHRHADVLKGGRCEAADVVHDDIEAALPFQGKRDCLLAGLRIANVADNCSRLHTLGGGHIFDRKESLLTRKIQERYGLTWTGREIYGTGSR